MESLLNMRKEAAGQELLKISILAAMGPW